MKIIINGQEKSVPPGCLTIDYWQAVNLAYGHNDAWCREHRNSVTFVAFDRKSGGQIKPDDPPIEIHNGMIFNVTYSTPGIPFPGDS